MFDILMLDYFFCFNQSIYILRQDKDNSYDSYCPYPDPHRTNLMSIVTINKGRV